MTLEQIISNLLQANLNAALDNKAIINDYISQVIDKQNLDNEDLKILDQLVHIGNLVYNNSDLDDDMQPIENGIYDILLEKCKRYIPDFRVGAEPINFNQQTSMTPSIDAVPLITFVDIDKENSLYIDDILDNGPMYTLRDMQRPLVSFAYESGKKYRDTLHSNPELVGTLDACKYVLNYQAIEKDAFEDPKVRIFERDFLHDHLKRGLINYTDPIKIMLELKYDGTSVVVSIVDGMVVKAESRGDTKTNMTTDLTPILYGYTFPHLPKKVNLDCKCEAIMTYKDLYYYNLERGKDYKNCRSAINGVFSLNEGYLYQKYITLIPLKIASSSVVPESVIEPIDRLTEIEFMNKYLRKGEILRHTYIEGTYTEILFMIKKFVEEAEYVRDIMPFMYDGVVVSYVDEDIISALGRENSINKYSVAIKFNALKKQTIFRGYTFTIGQDGTVTPMAHYNPVEFFGTIHTKSSVSSFNRFTNLSLKEGDIIEVEYVHDVMPYVTKPDLDVNNNNTNPIIPFISNCPSCDSILQLSTSGKSSKCMNLECPERNIQRISNMMAKLDIKDFAESNMEKIDIYNLTDLLHLNVDDIKSLGELTANSFIERMNNLSKEAIYDFIIVGALGFTGIAQDTWKKIFNVYTLNEILSMYNNNTLSNSLSSIKGIGPITIDTICKEFNFFYRDLMTISKMTNIIDSKGLVRKKIRLTGFRDRELIKELNELGYDASDGSVTKDTHILLVPVEGHTSSKTKAAGPNTKIIPVSVFKSDQSKYL